MTPPLETKSISGHPSATDVLTISGHASATDVLTVSGHPSATDVLIASEPGSPHFKRDPIPPPTCTPTNDLTPSSSPRDLAEGEKEGIKEEESEAVEADNVVEADHVVPTDHVISEKEGTEPADPDRIPESET